jgi:hypothetical protein
MVIRALIFANNKKEALSKANHIFQELIDLDHAFDYYTLFNDNSSKTSGKARWGSYPVVAELKDLDNWKNRLMFALIDNKSPLNKSKEDDKAWNILIDGIIAYKNELINHLNHIRKGLGEYTNEDFWEVDKKKEDKIRLKNNNACLDIDGIKHYMYSVGKYSGPNVWLYDQDGEGIRDMHHLTNVLERWKSLSNGGKDYINKKLYIVPADVHF